MKRKFIELEVDTGLTNKELKKRGLWRAMNPVIEIIQIKVNAVKDWKRK